MIIYDRFCVTAEHQIDLEPQETGHNTINEYEEQRRQQVEQHCDDMVDEDVRCEWTCHKSCTACGKDMLQNMEESICEPGGEFCADRTCKFDRQLLLPCWYEQLLNRFHNRLTYCISAKLFVLVCTGYHVTEQFHTKATFIATNYGVLNFGAGTQNIKTDQPHVLSL